MISITLLNKIVQSIIEHQSLVIGPLAIYQAKKVRGLVIHEDGNLTVELRATNPEVILEDLVEKYKNLFGQTSVEVCKDAIKESNIIVSDKDLPKILR